MTSQSQPTTIRTVGIATACALVLGACGGKTVFRLSSDENNTYALEQTLAQRQLPATPSPVNSAHQPRVFAVLAGSPHATIVAYDLASNNVMWRADADVGSRIAVGGDFIVELEGKQLVARDQARGQPRWRVDMPGTFVGVAADRDRAYAVYQSGPRTWFLAGYDGASGNELWKDEAEGQLGAPAAQGGVVYAPFLRQWLSLVDGRSGKQLTRLRSIDQDITMVRVTSRAAYYGSKQGMFELDARSASGERARSTFWEAKVPPQLAGTTYGREVYDPVQVGYTAADRKRTLWTTQPAGDQGPMRLSGDGYVVCYFRYVFGFGLDGGVRWAYSHPRVELVASTDTGKAIVAVSASGDVVALDPDTGAVLGHGNFGTPTSHVLGATFDADGWAPGGKSEPVETVRALVSIARDRDARFDRVKQLAVATLAKLPGPEVTNQLLEILSDDRAPQPLKDAVVDLLVERKDPSSLPVLAKQLDVHYDYLAGTEPESLGAVARTIAGLAGIAVDRKAATEALAALGTHLDAPETATADLVWVIGAMSAIGGGEERLALGSHLLLYHADSELGADVGWQTAIVKALYGDGIAAHELLRQVAADPRTQPTLADTIRGLLPE